VSQSGTGTVYQSGGIVRAINGTDGLAMNQNNSANGTYNLSGGELQANSWKPIVAGAVSTFNFSGGTIRPHTNNLTIKTALTLTGDNGSLNSTDSLGSGRTLTVSQPIGETGGAHNLMLAGTGTISLATNNVHSGVTTLAGGTLSIAHPMALQNSALDYTDGAVTFATGITAAQFGGLTGTGNLLLVNASSVGVALSVSNTATMTYGGVLSDNSKSGSLVKTGSGTLILSNASSYSGATTVNSGTLVVNGATTNSAITVASGAALCGVGSVGTVTISNNATLSAGNPSAVGSLTATNLTLAEGANVAWDYNAGSGDLVTVNGNINLPTNATVTVTGTGGLPASRVMFTGTLLGAMDLNWTFTGSGVKPNMRAVRSGNNVSLVIPTGFILNFY
jgi:autotransporter-associated beta strand protein